VLALFAWTAMAACTDVRDFRGTWTGDSATLQLDRVDTGDVAGSVTLPGGAAAALRMSSRIETDALSTITFAGAPLRVYLAYFDPGDGCGEALAVISLHENRRVELRVLRGASTPGTCDELFGRYALAEGTR
jgi:hypothetical protein